MNRPRGVCCAVAFGLMLVCVFVTTGAARECPEFAGLIPGGVSVVEVSGDYAYLANGTELVIADISNPAIPVAIAGLQVRYSGYWWHEAIVAVAVADGYALVASSNDSDGSGSLYLVDVRTPLHPVVVRSLEVDAPIHDLAIDGGYAYVVAGGGYHGGNRVPGSLLVLDVRHPPNMSQRSLIRSVWWAPEGVAAANGYVFIADSSFGLRVYDVSNPLAPVEVSHQGMAGKATIVTVANDYAFVVTSADSDGELCVMDVSAPTSPVEIGDLEISDTVLGVDVSGGYAYLAQGETGIRVVDVSVPSEPETVGLIDTVGEGLSAVIADDVAFISDGNKGLQLLDVSDPLSPVALGGLNALGPFSGLAATGELVFISTADGLLVLDMTTPSKPVEVGSLESSEIGPVVAWEDKVYIIGGDGLSVIDVSEPSSPIEIASLDGDWVYPWRLGIAKDKIYILGLVGFHVIDISSPDQPTQIGFLEMPEMFDSITGLSVYGSYVYLTGYDPNSLYVIDVSLPSAPTILVEASVTYCENWCVPFGLSATGRYAYLVANAACPYSAACFPDPVGCWLSIVDLVSPAEPELVGHLTVGDSCRDISVAGNHALIWEGEILHVFDVSTPSVPVEERTVTTPVLPYDPIREAGYIFARFGSGGGLYVLDVRGCGNPYERRPISPPAIE